MVIKYVINVVYIKGEYNLSYLRHKEKSYGTFFHYEGFNIKDKKKIPQLRDF